MKGAEERGEGRERRREGTDGKGGKEERQGGDGPHSVICKSRRLYMTRARNTSPIYIGPRDVTMTNIHTHRFDSKQPQSVMSRYVRFSSVSD